MSETNRSTVPAAEEILGKYFPVLDKGFISLVDYMGGDTDIEASARVSYGAGNRKVTETRGLLRYLRRHHHDSPYEQVSLKFHMALPIFVARQLIRHRTAKLNEFSGRYSIIPDVFYTPDPEQFRKQSSSNKQGRDEKLNHEDWSKAVVRWGYERKIVFDNYKELLDEGLARELARIDLPLSTYTIWYWKMDLRNLFHLLGLRSDSHAQYEIQTYSDIMAGMAKRVAPLAFEAWEDYNFYGCNLSRQEMDIIRSLFYRENDTIQTRDVYIDVDRLPLKGRELDEFLGKLGHPPQKNFDLDLSKIKPKEYFQEMYRVKE